MGSVKPSVTRSTEPGRPRAALSMRAAQAKRAPHGALSISRHMARTGRDVRAARRGRGATIAENDSTVDGPGAEDMLAVVRELASAGGAVLPVVDADGFWPWPPGLLRPVETPSMRGSPVKAGGCAAHPRREAPDARSEPETAHRGRFAGDKPRTRPPSPDGRAPRASRRGLRPPRRGAGRIRGP